MGSWVSNIEYIDGSEFKVVNDAAENKHHGINDIIQQYVILLIIISKIDKMPILQVIEKYREVFRTFKDGLSYKYD